MPPAPPSPELPELLPLTPPELDEPELALLPPLELAAVDPLEPLAPLEDAIPPELDPATELVGEPVDEQPLAKRLAPTKIDAERKADVATHA